MRRTSLALLAVTLAGCGAASRSMMRPIPTPAAVAQHPRPAGRSRPPGELPQTAARPAARSLHSSALWHGILAGRVAPARAAFFPLAAYRQVKAISDPAADYRSRLLHEFTLDLVSAHALTGGRARLIGVRVPQASAHWVRPGACFNRVGYWEVPNTRLVYRDIAGTVRSFGIASLISWRGRWYVVHLGAVTRPAVRGVVDSPQLGPGVAAPSATC